MSLVPVHNPRLRSVRSILTAALARIEQGWTRNTERRDINGVPHFCSVGAIRSVARDGDAEARAVQALAHALEIGSVISWNDQDGMRKRNVIKGFKQAIKTLA